MSRRSSFGRAVSRDGFHSPAGSVMSRPGMVPNEAGKPVVRLPPPIRGPVAGMPTPSASMAPPMHPAGPNMHPPPPYPMPQHPLYRENRPIHPTPIHQPRPQKAVSVADIESPMGFPFNPPQPQQEQPFHQQVPQPVHGQGYVPESTGYPQPRHSHNPSQVSTATPLSQIPERAIHAQPFQPFPYQSQPYYPPSGYPPGAVFYPSPGTSTDYGSYNAPVQSTPSYVPPGQPVQYPIPPSAEQPASSNTVAHEANGTVYYYDSSQFQNAQYAPNAGYPAPPPQPPPPQGGVVGMGGMLTPPGTTYYYSQPQNGTVFYT